MIAIYLKELSHFFSSLIAYIVIGVFLVFMALVLWVLPESSIIDNPYATLGAFFSTAPIIFTFVIPAITMASFSEERQQGTIELLFTKPLKSWQIISGKYLANLTLIIFALIPTLVYYYSVYQLSMPVGNIDTGSVIGSYIGLILLAAAFVAIGTFSSGLTSNQVVAFVVGTFICFIFHWGFDGISKMTIFYGVFDDLVQRLGMNYHYLSLSRGLLDSRDVIYFLSIILLFLYLSYYSLTKSRK
jgi:ABC-2 type transport system permease protein